MSDEITIRRATEEDAGDIARIYNYAVLNTTSTFDMEAKSVEDRAKWLRSHGDVHPVYVAELEGKVVGWASLSPYRRRTAYRYTVENAVYVDCDHQGLGVGSSLMQTLVDAAEGLGYHVILASVVGGNVSSIRLHEKFDFKLAGIMHEVGKKFGQWLDILIYERISNCRG